jgi:hypothetical protein
MGAGLPAPADPAPLVIRIFSIGQRNFQLLTCGCDSGDADLFTDPSPYSLEIRDALKEVTRIGGILTNPKIEESGGTDVFRNLIDEINKKRQREREQKGFVCLPEDRERVSFVKLGRWSLLKHNRTSTRYYVKPRWTH